MNIENKSEATINTLPSNTKLSAIGDSFLNAVNALESITSNQPNENDAQISALNTNISSFGFNNEVNAAIWDRAEHWNLNPRTLAAVVFLESSGRTRARTDGRNSQSSVLSEDKAYGLMQLKPSTFNEHLPGGDIFDPKQNIDAAMMELQEDVFPILVERYGIDPSTLTAGELYVIYQQGSAGGTAIVAAARGITLENVPQPDGSRVDVTPGNAVSRIVASGVSLERDGWKQPETPREAATRLNRNIPSGGFTHDDGRTGNADNMTAEQFVEMWSGRMRGQGDQKLFLD